MRIVKRLHFKWSVHSLILYIVCIVATVKVYIYLVCCIVLHRFYCRAGLKLWPKLVGCVWWQLQHSLLALGLVSLWPYSSEREIILRLDTTHHSCVHVKERRLFISGSEQLVLLKQGHHAILFTLEYLGALNQVEPHYLASLHSGVIAPSSAKLAFYFLQVRLFSNS